MNPAFGGWEFDGDGCPASLQACKPACLPRFNVSLPSYPRVSSRSMSGVIAGYPTGTRGSISLPEGPIAGINSDVVDPPGSPQL